MAYSCVRVSFEIGHEASIRNKRTPEGFTHDWEVFVRGADNTDINHFVDKVVFYLHETFPKPKRVVKEPPYSVKESGYAGFNLPIDVYFKNHEPKKVRFNYDLHLQPSGPPISKVLREKYVFPNPAEDLRRRLIKGGGVGVVGSEASIHLASIEKPSIIVSTGDETSIHKHSVPPLVGKPKLGGDTTKKHKVKEYRPEEPRASNSFADLFGPPIKTAKVSPDPKKPSHSPKVSPVPKASKPVDKTSSDKQVSGSKPVKHIPQKEVKDTTDRSSSSTKEEKRDKNKERDKSKEKPQKRPSTPPKHPSSPPKRPSTPPKRPSTPPKHPTTPSKSSSTSPKQSTTPKSSKDDSKKSASDESKGKSDSKSGDVNKSEKKKKDKKSRDEKPKKDKHKEHDSKVSDKVGKSEKSSKESKEKDIVKKVEKEPVKEPDKPRDKEKEKPKHGDGDKEKQRHKHKKKEKSSKERDKEREKDKDREKSIKKSSENRGNEIKDKEKNGMGLESSRAGADGCSDISSSSKKQSTHSHSPSPSPVRAAVSPVKPSPTPEKLPSTSVSGIPSKEKTVLHPLDLLSDEESSDSSSSPLSGDDDLDPPVKARAVTESCVPVPPIETKSTPLPTAESSVPGNITKANNKTETAKPKSEASSQERNSLNKSSNKLKEKGTSKRSKDRKEENIGDVDKDVDKDVAKVGKDASRKRKRKNSGKGEEGKSGRNNGETAPKITKLEAEPAKTEEPIREVSAAKESDEPKFEVEQHIATAQLTAEYVTQLKELQHKIMTLEDNADLQRVVQVIAETGQYEITKKTFDFDLCALDRSTVKRLQDFFTAS